MVKYWGSDGFWGWMVQSVEATPGERGSRFGSGVWIQAPDPGYGGDQKPGSLPGTDGRHRRDPAGEVVQMRTAGVPSRRGGWEP